MRFAKFVAAFGAAVLFPALAWAALPLITDDTGTQGKGRFQIEVGGEYDHDKEMFDGATVKETDFFLGSTLTYGISEPIDVFVNVPYAWTSSKTDQEATIRVHGIADTGVGIKWRFFEKEGLSLGLKPFITLPTGNDEKSLGTGRIDGGVILILSKESGPWAIHANAGYTRNANTIQERKDLWQASAAVSYEVIKNWKLCGDVGAQTNRDKTSEVEPGYLLGGVIYAPGENLELSLGIKFGLNKSENDLAILPGWTYRF